MDNFREIQSPATAQAGDNMSQAAATMSNPASQIMFKEASTAAGNTAHSFLPNLAIDGAQAQANPRQAALDFDSYAYLKNQEQHGSVRKYDNSSFGIGLGEGDFE